MSGTSSLGLGPTIAIVAIAALLLVALAVVLGLINRPVSLATDALLTALALESLRNALGTDATPQDLNNAGLFSKFTNIADFLVSLPEKMAVIHHTKGLLSHKYAEIKNTKTHMRKTPVTKGKQATWWNELLQKKVFSKNKIQEFFLPVHNQTGMDLDQESSYKAPAQAAALAHLTDLTAKEERDIQALGIYLSKHDREDTGPAMPTEHETRYHHYLDVIQNHRATHQFIQAFKKVLPDLYRMTRTQCLKAVQRYLKSPTVDKQPTAPMLATMLTAQMGPSTQTVSAQKTAQSWHDSLVKHCNPST